MPDIILHIPTTQSINVSVQKGDTAYYLDNVTTLGTHNRFNHSNFNDIIEIGMIKDINRTTNAITCEWAPNPPTAYFPVGGSYIMFSKDNKVNLSSLLGYYAELEIINNSSEEAELFSIASDVFISSK